MGRSAAIGLTLLVSLAWVAARAQDQDKSAGARAAAKDGAAGHKRLVYVVKHGAAKGLADVLGKHFKGADVAVEALPDGPGNLLLIRAAPGAFPEVVQLLDKLDRQPRLVSVQLLIAEVNPQTAPGAPKGPPDAGPDERELTGTMEQVQARVDALVKAGRIGSVRRVRLTAVEGQASHTLVGENKPYVAGVQTTGTGVVSRMIHYRNTGFSVTVTPHVSPDQTIQLDLRVQDSYPHVPPDGVQIGTDEKGPVRATEFISSTLEAKVAVAPGRALPVRGVKTTSKSGRAQTLVIVSAQVVDAAAGAGTPPENKLPGKGRPTKPGLPPP
jgi:type II secretory pathway component GspD/PulD (secretin)